MSGLSFTFMRIRGIPIKLHLTFLILVVIFLAPTLGAPGDQRGRLLVINVIIALLFFTSILLHELGHAFQAMREKLEINDITLWGLGGVANIISPILSPGVDFRVAAAGPAVTAVLAGLFKGFQLSGGPLGLPPVGIEIARIAAFTQFVILGFNLVPAWPLDGGRIFRSWLWQRRGNMTSASKTASAVGRAFGVFMIVMGGVSLLIPGIEVIVPVFRFFGVFSIVIGFFIFQGAREQLGAEGPPGIRRPAEGFMVGDFTNPEFIIVEPKMTISRLLDALSRLQLRPTALVLEDGQPVGMISKHVAEKVPESERDSTSVADVMVPKDQIRAVRYEDPLRVARTALESGPETVVVLHNDVVVGLVSVSDMARAMVEETSRPA